MGDLTLDTAVEGGDGTYRAQISRDWEIWGPNGGYLAAIALRAAAAHSGQPRPASFYCHFLSVAEFGPADLAVRTVRSGKRADSVVVSMTQDGKPVLESLVWVVAEAQGLTHEDAKMPSVPTPSSLIPSEEIWPEPPMYRFWMNLEQRGPLISGPGTQPLPIPFAESLDGWLCWYRFRPTATFDDPFLDAARQVILLDTLMWPAASVRYPWPTKYLAPSIDVAVNFHRSAPAEEWILVDAKSHFAGEGLVSGTSRLWTEDGRLLASGMQQMLCRPNPMAAEG